VGRARHRGVRSYPIPPERRLRVPLCLRPDRAERGRSATRSAGGRKATLASVLAKAAVGIRFNEHLEFDDGEAVFHHACKMGLEGIVSKRKDSTYRSGRTPDWLKMKNPACEAVRPEAEEDWGR
jgi:hypothetical protein